MGINKVAAQAQTEAKVYTFFRTFVWLDASGSDSGACNYSPVKAVVPRHVHAALHDRLSEFCGPETDLVRATRRCARSSAWRAEQSSTCGYAFATSAERDYTLAINEAGNERDSTG